MNKRDQLKRSGFDMSSLDLVTKKWMAKCSKCVVTIDDGGIPRHVDGCPNRAAVDERHTKERHQRVRTERKGKLHVLRIQS